MSKKNTESNEHPYMICSIDGFDRVPDTVVLLKTEDYDKLIKYLSKAAEEDPDADILIDPDDGGDCVITLDDFNQGYISAKPIRTETYEDIRQVYTSAHFGFNYVLDAVLDAIFNVLESTLKPAEVKWFMQRSELVEWSVKDNEKNKAQSAKIDKQSAYLAANSLRNYSTEVCHDISGSKLDMPSLRENIRKITDYAAQLESLILE